MAITQHILTMLKQIKQEGKFKNAQSVLEMGSQSVLADIPQVCTFLSSIGRQYDASAIQQKMSVPRISSQFLYEEIGFTSYEAIDLDSTFNPHKFDLNEDLAAKYNFTKQFDLVTNLGMSEHIMNQLVFFKNMHNTCKTGGLLFHVVPMHDVNNHGFFHYTPLFFRSMAKLNEYRIEGMWISVSPSKDSDFVFEYSAENTKQWYSLFNLRSDTTVFLVVLYRKVNEAVFVTPYDMVVFVTINRPVMADFAPKNVQK